MSQDPLHLICVEPRFPGRLGAVADWLVRRRGYRCQFYCNTVAAKEHWPEGVGQGLDVVAFNVGGVAREASVAWQKLLERSLCYAFGAFEVINSRRPRPVDVVLARSEGLGSSLFANVYAPRIPVVQYFDYYYHGRKNDLADEMGPTSPTAYHHWRRAANAIDLLDLDNGVLPWAATPWQRELYPREYRDDFLVLHDGVDTRRFRPRGDRPRIIAGRVIPEGTKVLTFVSRTIDRLRGIDRFLKLANALIRDRADVLAIAVGEPMVARTLDVAFHGKDYRAIAIKENPPSDPDRLWFGGYATQASVAEVLAASDLHVYPSRPYPTSRSLIQAMASSCPILAIDNDPVRELIRPGVHGLLASGDDPDEWLRFANQILDDPVGHRPLGESARSVVLDRYAQDVTLPRLAERFNELAGLGGR